MSKFLTAITVFLFAASTHAQDVTLQNVYPGEIEVQGFSMEKDGSISIEGTGAMISEDWKLMIYYGWILDTDSRQVVWHLFDFMKDQDLDDDEGVFDFEALIDLKEGNYELYLTAMTTNRNWDGKGDWSDDLGEAIDWLFNSRDRRSYSRRFEDDIFIKLDGKDIKSRSDNELFDQKENEAIVSLNRVRNDERLSKGFTLTKATDLKVYVVGEADKDELYDHGWITDASTGKRVFESSYRYSDYAGGAKKNFKMTEKITLQPGSYLVNYRTDDSHSYGKWNSLPPDDPQFWGISVFPATKISKSNVVAFREPKTMIPLVSLTEVRDDETLAQGLTIKKEMKVRVLCLGEEGSSNFVDYGWIVDANSREKVWKMKSYKADHAGGADKNRYIDEVITLEPGDYIAYYTTDDSHAYRDWNSSEPFEPEMWGITIWATNEDDLKYANSFNPENFKSENELAVIAMVGDHALEKRTFSVQQDAKVRIIGLGEGSSGEMHDYGFLKNMDTGEIVWEMEYRNSEHAGGARKNREFNETMYLEKGTYRLYFETDGSHSYERWNADPPRNPEMWGIAILKN